MLVQANALQIPLDSQSVHMACFSPPYWGLRDYGVDGQLGLEPSPDDYIAAMLDVMAEVWRVLRDDGSCWVNLGDTYYRDPKRGNQENGNHAGLHSGRTAAGGMQARASGLMAEKNLSLIPFRFALAVQQAGWIVRQDIIWSKPNPMPESVRDRPTTAHEHVFLLSKQQRYFYDGDAIRVAKAPVTVTDPRTNANGKRRERGYPGSPSVGGTNLGGPTGGRNARSVWHIATQPYSGAHFATWPEKLVRRMVKAGTSERGVCPECGSQWERVVERQSNPSGALVDSRERGWPTDENGRGIRTGNPIQDPRPGAPTVNTVGWKPACACDHDAPPIPATVLDPFCGSGTTNKVARELGRRAVGLDLSAEYLRLAKGRNRQMTLWEA